jgi:hypothetical protein
MEDAAFKTLVILNKKNATELRCLEDCRESEKILKDSIAEVIAGKMDPFTLAAIARDMQVISNIQIAFFAVLFENPDAMVYFSETFFI